MKIIYQTFIDPEIRNKLLINRALEMIPNYFQFERRNWYELPECWNLDGDWSEFHIPKEDCCLVIQKISGKSGYRGGTIGKSCSVGVVGDESFEVLYLRILHELLHTLGLPADDMMKSKEFVEWLDVGQRLVFVLMKRFMPAVVEHNPKWQILYYMFLLEKFVGGEEDV